MQGPLVGGSTGDTRLKTQSEQKKWVRRWRFARARVRSELYDLLVDVEVAVAALGVVQGRCLAKLRRRFQDDEPKNGGHS